MARSSPLPPTKVPSSVCSRCRMRRSYTSSGGGRIRRGFTPCRLISSPRCCVFLRLRRRYIYSGLEHRPHMQRWNRRSRRREVMSGHIPVMRKMGLRQARQPTRIHPQTMPEQQVGDMIPSTPLKSVQVRLRWVQCSGGRRRASDEHLRAQQEGISQQR